jgi:2,3-bisphosphoglycerate-dependent phosphoglycerate mutase
MLTVYLVRHAEPFKPGLRYPNEYTRPLTQNGLRDAQALADELAHLELDAVYASPYRRAIQTVEPLATARGLTVQTVADWREHTLAPKPIPDWKETLERAWEDFDFMLNGGETMRSTQTRGMNALEIIRSSHAAARVAVGGHGTIFALVLNALEPGVDCAFHLAMPMPAVYTLQFDRSWRIASGPGF